MSSMRPAFLFLRALPAFAEPSLFLNSADLVESRPGGFTVTMGAVREEITLALKFSSVRTGGKQ